ncbi:MAG: carotenoid 1,2-hydratase [Gammaproteobacteria bacterium]|nr:carotenoid 1,2-hydratase [Gammaproteobacteria bacterium]
MRGLASLLAVLLLAGCGADPGPSTGVEPPFALTAVLGANADDPGFARALAPRRFSFPADHGAHPEFRTEWWYVTGNLRANDGSEFGYQLTLFRYALSPEVPASTSAWRTNRVWLGHVAITDLSARSHDAFERFSREALNLAGSTAEPIAIWLDDWRIERDANDAWHLRAGEGGFTLELVATPRKPPVLQGEAGLSRKSAVPGNASYYYSLPRLDTQGTLTTPRGEFEVAGTSWLDREWSTSALGAEQTGWDWFALQLDDGSELMLYRIRRADGSIDPASAGTLVDPTGIARPLGASAVIVTPTEHWRSPNTGSRYPIAWRIELPSQGIDVTVTARLPDQEMALTLRYWEGAVMISGQHQGRPVRGMGYAELTGY